MDTLKRMGLWVWVVFASGFILTFPFPYHVLPNVGHILSPYFEVLPQQIGSSILGIHTPYTAALISDSTGLYIHTGILLLFAVMVSGALVFIKKLWPVEGGIAYWFPSIISHYLALQLLIYGLSKVFKHQFYLPEPNTLFTPLGHLSPDLAYWSTMGASYSYTVFSGVIEVIPALLLLFRPTRAVGAVIALAVMLNVTALNFTYDISVKVYSCFLLVLAVGLCVPVFQNLYRVFVRKQFFEIPTWKPNLNTPKRALIYSTTKAAAVGLILFESLFIYFHTGSFNDDTAPRNFLHGAYTVELYVQNGDTLPPLLTDTRRPRRVFIHRHNYFIVQGMDDQMRDYKLAYTSTGLTLGEATHPQGHLHYSLEGENLKLQGDFRGTAVEMHLRAIPLDSLPLLRPGFHWTIDSYN